MSERWFVNNKFQADQFCEYIRANQNKGHIYEIIPVTRTGKQNDAIHAYCREVASVMAAHGMDMKTVIKDGVPIEPTMYLIKDYMWRPIQKAVTGVESTRKINPMEVNDIYEVLSRLLSRKILDQRAIWEAHSSIYPGERMSLLEYCNTERQKEIVRLYEQGLGMNKI